LIVNTRVKEPESVGVLVLLGLLVLIWSMPGTIALRSLLLLALFSYVVFRRKSIRDELRDCSSVRIIFIGFGFFSGWALIHSIWVSQAPDWSLNELAGQHPRVWVALVIGVGLGALYSAEMFRLLKIVLLTSLILHLGDYLLHWVMTGKTFIEAGITGRLFGQKLLISYLANLYAALVCADFLSSSRRNGQKRMAFILLGAEALFILFMTVLIGARNGYIGLAVLAGSTTFLYGYLQGYRKTRHLVGSGVIVISAAIVMGLLTWHTDPRWERFFESAQAALDGKQHLAWLNERKYPLPILSDGRPADHSAYMRVAGIRGAIEAALEYPQGYGFGRNAYSRAWRSLVGEGQGSSLSGLGDVLVGLGFPGLLIWLGFCVSLMLFSLKTFIRDKNAENMAMFFIVAGFLGRSLVDSNIRDHSLEMFIFLIAALASSACAKKP